MGIGDAYNGDGFAAKMKQINEVLSSHHSDPYDPVVRCVGHY